MKIVVQNGAQHGLARREVEAMIPLFPSSWCRVVESLVLCRGEEAGVQVSFHSKEKSLALYWPSSSDGLSKVEAVEALLVALAVVSKTGEYPKRIGPSIRAAYADSVADLVANCLKQVVSGA